MGPEIFGYMRFSYLGRSDAKLARGTDDLEERKQVLYAPERLDERFYFFEKICLPSLRWQTDKDFRFAIFTSPEMPKRYRKRLAKSVRKVPQVEIVYSKAPHISEAIDPWIRQQKIVHARRTVHFRLDDDDALSSDFIATLRKHMDNVPDHSIISRPSGLFLMDSAEGPELLAKFEPYIAIGFAIVNPPGTIRNPYHLMHGKHFRYVPSLSLPGPFAFIHTAHIHSDTVAAQRGKLSRARADHATFFEGRPRRFKQAIEQQFGGRKPAHFLEIMRKAPSRRRAALPATAASPQPLTEPVGAETAPQ